jgi:hypothetical protein
MTASNGELREVLRQPLPLDRNRVYRFYKGGDRPLPKVRGTCIERNTGSSRRPSHPDLLAAGLCTRNDVVQPHPEVGL